MVDKLTKKAAAETPKYQIGQKVIVTLPKTHNGYLRRSKLEPYVGQVGEVRNYYHMSTIRGEVFYIYTVNIGPDNEIVAFHTNELIPTYSANTERRTMISRIRTFFRRSS